MNLLPDFPTIRQAGGATLRKFFVETEWLQTDGVGGFASGTLLGTATRRYHGLLVARPRGSSKRHVFLARFDESLRVGHGPALALDPTDYDRGSVSVPDGFACRWHRSSGVVRRSIVDDGGVAEFWTEARLLRGSPAVVARYSVRGLPGRGAVELGLRPMVPFREADALTFCNDAADLRPRPLARTRTAGFALQLYGALPALYLTWEVNAETRGSGADAVDVAPPSVEFVPEPRWHRGVRFSVDLARGYGGHEDHPSPGRLVVRSDGWFTVTIAASLDAPIVSPVGAFDAECEREADARRGWCARFANGDDVARCVTSDVESSVLSQLAESNVDDSATAIGDGYVRAVLATRADDFLYRAPDHRRLGICAGYPWFGEWGRDTFLSLPGLTLARGQLDACREVLAGALPFLRNGLLPNIYGVDVDDSHYGSVDASLWFARAADLYVAAAEPTRADASAFVADLLLPALRQIADAYRDGTELGIGADDGMLIRAGGPHLNATWMDARTPAGPVTPRDGCAVEINALWIALLDFVAELERKFGADGGKARAAHFDRTRGLASATFLQRFWLSDAGYLADRWQDGVVDRKIRPNMVLAAALGRSPLDTAQRRGVVDVAATKLWTRCGLRTLAPDDPAYVARYRGGCDQRDLAYHQGTVWPWLLGSYVEARLRAYGPSEVLQLRSQLHAFGRELQRAGLGHVSEVFDGDEPHEPGGTIAQAWNTAELLRSYQLLEQFESLGERAGAR